MRVCGKFLVECDIGAFPFEQKIKSNVDRAHEDRRVWKSQVRPSTGGISTVHKILCQKVVLERMLFLPKNKYIRFGLAFISASTTVLLNPAGLMAGAKAIKTSTLSLSFG